MGVQSHIGVRIQEITILAILLLLILIHKYSISKNYKILFWLLPLFYLWANTHAGFLIGLFVLGFWLGVKCLELILVKIKWFSVFKFENKQTVKSLGIFFGFALLTFLITLLTPYKTELYAFLKGYSNDFYLHYIEEWFPFYYPPIILKQFVYLAIVC